MAWDPWEQDWLSAQSRLFATIDMVLCATGRQLPDEVAALWSDEQRRDAFRWAAQAAAGSAGAQSAPRHIVEWMDEWRTTMRPLDRRPLGLDWEGRSDG